MDIKYDIFKTEILEPDQRGSYSLSNSKNYQGWTLAGNVKTGLSTENFTIVFYQKEGWAEIFGHPVAKRSVLFCKITYGSYIGCGYAIQHPADHIDWIEGEKKALERAIGDLVGTDKQRRRVFWDAYIDARFGHGS